MDIMDETTSTDTSIVFLDVPPSFQALALGNGDILQEIFNHMGIDVNSPSATFPKARKDLLNAAQTSKAFLEPALNALWRVLPSLFPLLKLLQSSLVLRQGKYVLLEVKDFEWEEFDQHARRVRILYLERRNENISNFVYLRLSRIRKTPFLPALKEIRIPNDQNVDLSVPFLGLGQTLEALELNPNTVGNLEFFQAFFTAVVTDSPQIRHLTLRGDHSEIDISPVSLLKSLHTLELNLANVYISSSLLKGLGNLEHLIKLKLHVGSSVASNAYETPVLVKSGGGKKKSKSKNGPSKPASGIWPDVWHPSLPTTGFQSLKKLDLVGPVTSMQRIMRPMSFRFLEAFTYHETHDNSTRGTAAGPFWIDFLEILAEGAHYLKTVTINQYDDPWESPLSLPLISPILRIHNLVTLEINNASISLSDTDFVIIVSSFSSLKRLALPDMCNSNSPTLMALWQPSIICSTLEELKICLFCNNAGSTIPTDLKAIRIRHQDAHKSLRRLLISSAFGQLSDMDVIHVARIFNCAFPELLSIEGCGSRAGQESWGRVELFRNALQEMREVVTVDRQVFSF